ncbi:MAG: hypothetical protein ACK4K0_00670 [Flavobacteriales bacterium]
MKLSGFLPFTLMLLALSLSCNCKKKGTKTPKPEIKSTITESGFIEPKENAPFVVKSVKVKGDILTIEVEYSGGCQKHEFDLFFNGIYMKSMPPKAGLILVHKNNGDNCRELITETLKFDLTSTRYGDTKDYTIIFSLNNHKEDFEYSY